MSGSLDSRFQTQNQSFDMIFIWPFQAVRNGLMKTKAQLLHFIDDTTS